MSIDINALKIGIYDALNVPAITNLVTGIYHKKAPQDASYPYILYWIVTGSNKDTFTEWKDEVLIQIDVYCQNKDKNENDVSGGQHCGVILKAVTTAMDEAEITAEGYSVFFCQRQGPPRDLYEDDTDTYHNVLEYRIEMEKSKI